VYGGHAYRKKNTAGLRKIAPEVAKPPDEPLPVWFAVLRATDCEAKSDGAEHIVNWNCVSGRAVYTNDGAYTEQIEPLGVSLQRGHTLAVSWTPGDTAYTLEVIGKYDCPA
jgi:hypothetical protein